MKDRPVHWSRGITLERYRELMATRRRPLTDDHPGLRTNRQEQPEGWSLIDKYVQPKEDNE
jgi:hypothetical protein